MNRLRLIVSTLALALLGCALTPPPVPLPNPAPGFEGRTPVPVTAASGAVDSPSTPAPIAATGESSGGLDARSLLDAVSADRLIADVKALSAIHSRQVNSATIGQAAEYIARQFTAAGGRLVVSVDEFPLTFNGISTQQRNVIATLPGSDPAAGIALVGAHYDSRTADLRDAASDAPGANDNATGVAAALELARLLANETLRRTVLFVAFSGEEVGRQGSIHFVKQAQARGEAFRGAIILDIVGSGAGSSGVEGSIRLFSAGPEGSPSRALARSIEAQVGLVLPGFEVMVQDAIDRPGRYSDHNSFSEAGFPAVRLIQPLEDEANHSGGDTADRVDPAYLRHATQVALVGLEWLMEQP